MAVTKLSEKVSARLKEHGSISSGDVAEFESGAAPRTDRGKALSEPTTAPVPKEAGLDPMLNASGDLPGEALKARQEADLAPTHDKLAEEMYDGDQSPPDFEDEKVELTPADKNAFIDAMVEGKRYERPFSLLDGRIQGVFRSRTSNESLAILKELSRQWSLVKLMTQDEYSTMLRFGMLSAQMKELNGVEYPEMKEPLMAQSVVVKTAAGMDKDEIVAPAWFGEMQARFGSKDEGLYTAIYRELRDFEKKYWALVGNAKDQNFWKPGTSTSA